MKIRGRLFLVAGVFLLAGAAAFLFFYNTRPKEAPAAAAAVQQADILVAATDLQPYTLLDEGAYETRKVDKATITADTATDPLQLRGKLVAASLKRGDRLLLSQVNTPGLAFTLAKGKKAMAVTLDDLSATAGLVSEGDYVDIIMSMRLPTTKVDSNGQPLQGNPAVLPFVPEPQPEYRPTTKTILQNIRVIRVLGSRVTAAAATDGAKAEQASQTQAQATPTMQQGMVVLEVTDQEAELIKYGRENGGLQYVLRARDDHDVETTTGVTTKVLIDERGVPVP